MLPFLIFSFAVWVVQSQDSGSGGDSGGNAPVPSPTTKTPAVTDGKSP